MVGEAVSVVPQVLTGVPHIGELRELGLGSYTTPVGLIENLTEFISASTGMPWAVGIALTTVLLRATMLPLIVKSMRNNVKLTNIGPEMQLLAERLKAAGKSGDKSATALYSSKLQKLMEDNDCHPLRSFVPILVQMPLFISVFFAIRKMAELPVESLKHGGYLWFTDLTLQDPYYALPFIASCTMFLSIELGSEGVKHSQPMVKNLLRAMPFVLLPVSASFPTGLFMYWISANLISLSQVLLFRVPFLRTALKIPAMKVQSTEPTSKSNESFIESARTAYEAYLERAKQTQKEQEAKLRAEAMAKIQIPKKPATGKNTKQ